jgi:Cof subfamily protein (haloacid dehalogenase superfamily)
MKVQLPDKDCNLALLKDFADVEIIVTDLDGTVIDGIDSVRDNISNEIGYLQRNYRVHFSVATGRTYTGALPVMKKLQLKDGIPVALYNGGVIMGYGTDKVFSKQTIEPDVVDDIFEYLKSSESSIYVYTFEISEEPLVTEEKNYTQEKVYGMGYKGKKFDSNGMPITWIDSSRQIQEMIVAVLIEEGQMDAPKERAVMNYLDENNMVEATNSGNGYIEIKGKGFNKGSIFRILKEHKAYKEKKTLAIGDNNNDIELFEQADISVAVVNSSKAATDVADYICKYEKGRGFLQMLRVMKEAKRFC